MIALPWPLDICPVLEISRYLAVLYRQLDLSSLFVVVCSYLAGPGSDCKTIDTSQSQSAVAAWCWGQVHCRDRSGYSSSHDPNMASSLFSAWTLLHACILLHVNHIIGGLLVLVQMAEVSQHARNNFQSPV